MSVEQLVEGPAWTGHELDESPSLLPGFDWPVAIADEVPVRRAGKADVVLVNAEPGSVTSMLPAAGVSSTQT